MDFQEYTAGYTEGLLRSELGIDLPSREDRANFKEALRGEGGFLNAYTLSESGTIIPINLSDGSQNRPNEHSTRSLAAVRAAIMSKALPISMMEIFVYQKVDGIKQKREDHSNIFLNKSPNDYITRNKWFETAVYHYEYYGNHYARILQEGNKIVLDMINPQDVRPIKVADPDNGFPMVFYKVKGIEKPIPWFNFIHVSNFSLSDFEGEPLYNASIDDLGWGLDLRQYGRAFFSNGAKPANVIEQDHKILGYRIDPNQQKQAVKNFQKHIGDKSGGTKIMPPGWVLKNMGFPNEQNQFLESKTYFLQDVARITNTPLHKLKELSNGTYSNLEVLEQNFAKDSLQPITESFESEYTKKLFSTQDQDAGYFYEFDYSKLLKFDPKTRGEYYGTLIGLGVITQDETRAMEGYNPHPNGVGAEPVIQMGFQKLKNIENQENG